VITVLYVDNCRPLMEIICGFLEKKGDMIVEASLTIEEALRKMDHIVFTVIVTDYNFGNSAGIDLLRKARQKGSMVPFIFFTMERDPDREADAARYGHVSFVPKLRYSGSGFNELEQTIRAVAAVPCSGDFRQSENPLKTEEGYAHEDIGSVCR